MSNDSNIYDVVSLNTEGERQSLKGFIDETLNCKRRIKMEQEAIRDIRNEAKERLNVPPKLFNKLVGIVLKDSLQKEQGELETVDELLTELGYVKE